MKNFMLKSVATLALLVCVMPTVAQEFRSSYFSKSSNFRHQMNPAFLDDSYASALLGQVNVGATGNVGLGNFIYDAGDGSEHDYVSFMDKKVDKDAFLGDLESENTFDLYLNYNLFSVGFKAFGGSNLIELNMRSAVNASVPYEFFKFAKEEGEGNQYEFENLSLNTQNYMELAFGHARNLNEKLRVGAKVKVLLGAAYADFKVNHLHLEKNIPAVGSGDPRDFYWKVKGDMHIEAALMDSKVKHSGAVAPDGSGRPRIEGFNDMSFGLAGFGLALDLGATYQLTDDLVLSAGLTDLGFINWNNVHAGTSAGEYEFNGFEHSGQQLVNGVNPIDAGLEDLQEDLENLFALYDDGDKSVSQSLAATLNAGAEYTMPFYRKMSVGLLYTGRFYGDYSWHQGMLSANIRPLKWLEVNANAAATSTGFTMGAMLSLNSKIAKFYIGSDRLIGSSPADIMTAKDANANLTLGLTIPL